MHVQDICNLNLTFIKSSAIYNILRMRQQEKLQRLLITVSSICWYVALQIFLLQNKYYLCMNRVRIHKTALKYEDQICMYLIPSTYTGKVFWLCLLYVNGILLLSLSLWWIRMLGKHMTLCGTLWNGGMRTPGSLVDLLAWILARPY